MKDFGELQIYKAQVNPGLHSGLTFPKHLFCHISFADLQNILCIRYTLYIKKHTFM